MKSPNWKMVDVNKLEFAAHNPKNRTKPEALKDLVDSMSRVGLIYPVLIDETNVLIDGHRRVSAARLLGWPEIMAVVQVGDRDEIYATVNATSRKMGGNDALGVWLKNPKAVAFGHNRLFGAMEEKLGRTVVRRIFDAGLSAKVYFAAKRILSYCNLESDDDLRRVVDWLLEFPVIEVAKRYMAVGQEPKTLLKAINAGKPIRFKAFVA